MRASVAVLVLLCGLAPLAVAADLDPGEKKWVATCIDSISSKSALIRGSAERAISGLGRDATATAFREWWANNEDNLRFDDANGRGRSSSGTVTSAGPDVEMAGARSAPAISRERSFGATATTRQPSAGRGWPR